MIKGTVDIDLNNVNFIYQNTGLIIDKADTPDFLNNFFANIAENTRGSDDIIDPRLGTNVSLGV